MESELIKKLTKEAEDTLKKIHELEEQIKEYKNGAESFSEATDALRKIEESQEDIVHEISNHFKKLDDIDSINIINRIGDLENKIDAIDKKIQKNSQETKNIKNSISSLEKKVDYVFRRKLKKMRKND